VRVILGATATNIQANDNATKATRIDVKSTRGWRTQVSARAFVLCTGTIESARLLLVSRDIAVDGLGNNRGLVGRYFQDHPTSDTATIVPAHTADLQDIYGVLYRGRTWYWPKLALAPERQRQTAALNASAFVTFEYNSSAIEVLRQMVRTTRTGGRFTWSPSRISKLIGGAPAVIDAGYRRYILGRSPRAKPSRIDLTCTIEQAPNPASRVSLADSRDRLGVPRPHPGSFGTITTRQAPPGWRLTRQKVSWTSTARFTGSTASSSPELQRFRRRDTRTRCSLSPR
jgi:choline dehydrogenase-like flavoprotein